jgi:hypothetical protein
MVVMQKPRDPMRGSLRAGNWRDAVSGSTHEEPYRASGRLLRVLAEQSSLETDRPDPFIRHGASY